ncbi:hypothetical protein OAX78_03475 [Planctomycetota bacterium]|nr:hypothetical protein [Planctomycetota bacterium]
MEPFTLDTGGLRYALDALPSPSASKTVLTVSLAEPASASADAGSGPAAVAVAALVDRVDLFSFGSRRRFAQLVAGQFGREPDAILGQLAVVIDAASRALAEVESPAPVELTPERKRHASALLRRPDLLEQAAVAMEALGFVGEPEAKRLGYLVVTSRLLDRPLSALVFAPTSSGKSELFEVLTRLLPPEHVEFLSRLTPQALFYAGPNALRHKVVVVDEHVGAKEAEYSLRTLLSRGSLTLRSSPRPGAGPARPFTVHGPISLLSGTTSDTVNEENLSRCLELTLDDSSAQTSLVHQAQRAAWAGYARPKVDLQQWRDAQRLIESTDVVIPFAPRLLFPARTSHDRRGNQKLLGLVAAHALLYQRQRERDDNFRVVATVADYAAVHALVRAAVRVDLGGLSPRAARAYGSLSAGKALTRRELAGEQGWAYNTAKKALGELVAQELAHVVTDRAPARYALVDRSLLGGTNGLLDPQELAAGAQVSTRKPKPKAVA